jgi:DtxR family Mn-dependent transcriptional regulator
MTVLQPLLILLLTGLALGILAAVFWPSRGLYHRWKRNREITSRVLREDAVKHLYKCETEGLQPSLESIAGASSLTVDEAAEVAAELLEYGLVESESNQLRLTADGQSYALHIIRAHRLWERYLADTTGVRESEWHARAERSEHTLSEEDLNTLSEQLGYPTHDPHGDPIPTAEGDLVSHSGQPLSGFASGQHFRIVHVEDEPEVVYSQLVAEGLFPGMVGRILETSARKIRFWTDGEEHVLAPLVAGNLSVVPLAKEEELEPSAKERLSALSPGEAARVLKISKACRGRQRRRLMDLGVLPGTRIEAILSSVGGDPKAYRIRGALIALRKEQADSILISRSEEPA